MQLTEDSQPVRVDFLPESSSEIRVSSGVVSKDIERIYFCTTTGLLLQLHGVDHPRWENHGRPPGANVSIISDGELYEYDQTSKPPWMKHVGSRNNASLAPLAACTLHGLIGPHSIFLLTKSGELIERRLHQRKWKWVPHGTPKSHILTSITCTSQDNPNSLLLSTASGFVFEYHINNQESEDKWVNHKHPSNARVARGIVGVQLQPGRTMFPLDDGRLAELHLSRLEPIGSSLSLVY